MTLDRKDYKSAIPQLEGRLAKIEKLGKDVFNKFEDIAHKTQLDAAEAEKKAAALDYQIDSINVVTEYQLQTNGQDPVEANWSTTMPSITYSSYNGKTLWARSVTYQNDIAIRKTAPQKVQLMDGLYTFVNSASGNTGWTMIDGDFIQTGKIASTNGYSYFDIDNNSFQMKDASTVALSNSVLAWQNGLLYVKGKIAVGSSSTDQKYYTEMTGGGFDIVANNVNLAHIGYGEGNGNEGVLVTDPYYSFGDRGYGINEGVTPTAYSSSRTYAEGDLCIYDGDIYVCAETISTAESWHDEKWAREYGASSLAEGHSNLASGWCSHAEGCQNSAVGAFDHAEGFGCIAAGGRGKSSNGAAHAEGVGTHAGYGSHTEGRDTVALTFSHAEGLETEATGSQSHSEGRETYAIGNYSHAQNLGTTAGYQAQTVIGKYNDNHSRNAFEIGSGAYDYPYNCFEVDWYGRMSTPQIQTGTIDGDTIGTVASHTVKTVSVDFNEAMHNTPVVVACLNSTSSDYGIGSVSVAVSGITTSGFTCKVFNADDSGRSPTVKWIAMNVLNPDPY